MFLIEHGLRRDLFSGAKLKHIEALRYD